jgi:hypothetical protein
VAVAVAAAVTTFVEGVPRASDVAALANAFPEGLEPLFPQGALEAMEGAAVAAAEGGVGDTEMAEAE